MIQSKKVIPQLAVAGLALSGCGDDGDTRSAADALFAFCGALQDCEIATVSDCLDGYSFATYITADYDEAVDLFGAACLDAYFDEFACRANLECADIIDEESCAAEQERIADNCEE